MRVQSWSTRFEKKEVKGNQEEEGDNVTKGMESVFYKIREEKLGS